MRRWMSVLILFSTVLMTVPVLAETAGEGFSEDWKTRLGNQVARIDADTPGNLGVYVKHLNDGVKMGYQADRPWYLSSTIKVPVAIALLQQVEEGKRSLDDQLILQQSDYVDGSGDLLWQEPGTRHTLRSLLEKMLADSDSTATDMLIRLIGEDQLQRRIETTMVAGGFHPISTILQVRYDAYSELHPDTVELTNMDFIELTTVPLGQERLRLLMDQIGAEPGDLRADSIEEAFERYYLNNRNAGSLEAFGELLERLVSGDLLSPGHTELMLGFMENISTGDKRIKAGLPDGVVFAQKTGTQVARACNVGIVNPHVNGGRDALVIAACVEKYGRIEHAEHALEQVGASLPLD